MTTTCPTATIDDLLEEYDDPLSDGGNDDDLGDAGDEDIGNDNDAASDRRPARF